jgi:hypothetical protein
MIDRWLRDGAPGPGWDPTGRRLPLLALVGLVLLLFHDVVFGGRVLYERDIHLIWAAQADAFVRIVAAGAWPVWNPYASFGQPLLANPNNQVLYPITWLNLLMRPETYYTLFVVSHLVLTGAGFHLLARRLGLSPLGAFVGAAAWVLSGPLLSIVQLWTHLAGAAWLPLVLLAADRAFATGRRRDVVLWGLAMAAQVFAGAPESLVAGGLLSLGLGLRHVNRGSARSAIPRLLAIAALAGAVGLAVSAAQWIPTLATARQTLRLAVPEDVRTFWSIHPDQIIEVVLPLELDRLALPAEAREVLFESREAFLASLYAGLPALVLVGAAVASGRRRSWLLLGVAVGATLLALGRHTPLYGVAATLLPVLGAFRYPAKAMIVSSFALALLVGLGLDASRQVAPSRRWHLLLVIVPSTAAVLVCTGAALLAFGLVPSRLAIAMNGGLRQAVLAPAAARLTVAAVLGAVMLVLELRSSRAGTGLRGAMLMAVLVILDLFVAHRGLNPTAPRELYALRSPAMDVLQVEDHSRLYVFDYTLPGRSQRYLGHDEGFRLAAGPHVSWRVAAAARAYLHPFTLGSFGLEGSYVADTIMLYPPYLEALTQAAFNAEETPAELRLLQAGAVSHVVALHERGFEDLVPVATRPSFFDEPMRVFRVPDALPRTYAVGTTRVADGAKALELLGDASWDLHREALVATGPPIRARASFTGFSEITAWRPDRVRIRAEASGSALVVLVDTYDPGWRVTIDGQPATARRVNLAFRGVEVSAGRHEVEWVYRPTSVLAGLLVSGLGLAAAIGLIARRGAASG